MNDLVSSNFKGQIFRFLDVLIIHPSCQIRRIFTMKNSPVDTTIEHIYYPDSEEIPKPYAFPVGMETITQIINMDRTLRSLNVTEDILEQSEKESKIFITIMKTKSFK